ncbi:hypothetical protein MLD38_034460 [Melastoma candidum]|uniref:Uncharacterized protein n=1 Tax=Melastoma candidum TaxID=119954 RepID=A0ACB9M9Z6_9MYRT|nr:hypothetical protein MLD38_034460 [Melastoma candidum]
MTSLAFLDDKLSTKTSIFGLRMWVLLGLCVGTVILLVLFFVSLYFISRRSASNRASPKLPLQPNIPSVSKEIEEIRVEDPQPDHQVSLAPELVPQQEETPKRIHVEVGKGNGIMYPEKAEDRSSLPVAKELALGMVVGQQEVWHLGWGHCYTMSELEEATDGFSSDNVIGEGGYGVVYRGVFEDSSLVAVKTLFNNRGQAEKEFRVEVEAIGRARHKNLVRLLGYCIEGAHRILVYEYLDNRNLEQWLHGETGLPLTWDVRMQIITGTAKGLTYLHEGLEPKVIHRDIKSSNILLDQQWNPKVSDFGLAKLLGSEKSYVTTRVIGTFGYVAPEYASTGMLNERSDVYSFGILIMEIISGRRPVDHSRPPGEVYLVEWLKTIVANRNTDSILDPRLPQKPSAMDLKRALLTALRCIDPNAQKRPKMGHVVHMLEADEFPFQNVRRSGQDYTYSSKRVSESGDSSGYESSIRSSLSEFRRQDTRGHWSPNSLLR